MSEQTEESKPEEATESNTASTETETVSTESVESEEPEAEAKPEVSITKCDACRTALEIACVGIIVGGAVVAAPEEITIGAIVAALTALGLSFGADKVREWISDAAKAGVSNIRWLAEFLCKKAGVC